MNEMKPELDLTMNVLESRTDEELQAVCTASEIITNKKAVDRPYIRLTEKEFFAHVDEGIAELNEGLGEDSDLVSAEIAAEFGLTMRPC